MVKIMETLQKIIDKAENMKNEYNFITEKGCCVPSDEAPEDFLKRVWFDYCDRLAYLDEEGYIMLSIFGGEGPMDNIHDYERGDIFYKLYIKVIKVINK